jgi:hypothetical protein
VQTAGFEAGAEEETEVAAVVVAARRWRFLLELETLLALVEVEVGFEDEEATVGFEDEGAAVVLILATAVEATGEPVMDVVVKTALGLCADIWDSTDAMAASVFWMVTGQVVQTLLGLLEMAAASAMAASTGRAKSWKRIVCVCCKECRLCGSCWKRV